MVKMITINMMHHFCRTIGAKRVTQQKKASQRSVDEFTSKSCCLPFDLFFLALQGISIKLMFYSSEDFYLFIILNPVLQTKLMVA